MIFGPSLGASWLANYYGEEVATETPPPPPPPQAETRRVGGPAFTGWHGGRVKGMRQSYVDGVWIDADTNVEEVGAPTRPIVPSPNAPTFEPPQPWTPDTDDEPAEVPHGREPLGITLPELPPRVVSPHPTGVSEAPAPRDNRAALILLLHAIGVWA